MRSQPLHDQIRCLALVAIIIPSLPFLQAADNPFAAGVRESAPQSPSDQQQSFHLPEGFEIELVASEPDIAKPMNLAFDAKGRLWVTDSYEYPFAAPLDRPGKDAIKVFEDSTGDGRYDKISTFAEGLNIPIGLYPYKNGVIAWSIPYISYFEDTDNDGKSDRQTKLYGPLGYERDTHGMNSSFTRGFDGWLYVTHGFNNNTTVKGSDGSEISMNSGNTYRIRLDGSRVEQFTYGQVNPFGMAIDPLGNLYTSDCHSMPAYLLLRDAYYPSFGKPHDGLGFCPQIMEHSHGSTAIDGVVYYSDDQWPVEFRDNVLIGNVMTSRVNRDTLLEVGSGKRAREEADFITTDDSWFRPVNMQFGPDGSLYIADFYNRIIGHYEVPLKHPGRDRHRGRIWKVSFRGKPGQSGQNPQPFDLTRLSVSGLFEEFKNPNLVRRQLALNYTVDTIGQAALPHAKRISQGVTPSNWQQRVQSLWLLHRLGALDLNSLRQAATDSSRELRVHAMRILSETADWDNEHRTIVVAGLSDSDLNVQRAAADALVTHADESHVSPILSALQKTPSEAPHLRHTLRIALRNQLRENHIFASLKNLSLKESQKHAVADVAIAIKSTSAANFLIDFLGATAPQSQQARLLAEHIAKHATLSDLDRLPALVDQTFPDHLSQRLAIYEAIENGNSQRGGAMSDAVQSWGIHLATKLVEDIQRTDNSWTHVAVPGMDATPIPWNIQSRRSADGDSDSEFLCSLSPGGEQFTGVIRSPEFIIPKEFSFFLSGHDGYPDKPAQSRNHVRLRLSTNAEIVATAKPPRNDTAQPIKWNTSAVSGRKGYLEITDSDDAGAYAWLAIGRFDPSVISLPKLSPQRQHRLLTAAARIAAPVPSSDIYKTMLGMLETDDLSAVTRAEIATALCRSHSHPLARPLAERIAEQSLTGTQSVQLATHIFSPEFKKIISSVVEEIFRSLPARAQTTLAQDLSINRNGAQLLLDLANANRLSKSLFASIGVQEKIRSHGSQLNDRLEQILKALPGKPTNLEDKIQSLTQNLSNHPGDPNRGEILFKQACQICHQINGTGALVGPQLEGIGNRGMERLLEDILDPNRNVDKAFQTQSVTLENGNVFSGLFRRDEGKLIYLINAAGQEFSIEKTAITRQSVSQKSLMPENFGELLETSQLSDLVTFLLTSGK